MNDLTGIIMGIDTNTYLGPYVVCPKKSVKATKTISGCPKCEISFSENKFCSTCGSPRGTFEKEFTQPAVDLWALSEELEECLTVAHDESDGMGKKDVYFVVNRKPKSIKRDFNIDNRNSIVSPFEDNIIKIEVELFKTEFEKELNILKKAFGTVNIQWGLLQWFN